MFTVRRFTTAVLTLAALASVRTARAATSCPGPNDPPDPVPLRTLYVASNGNDANAGTSLSAPLRTFAGAFAKVQAGDQVLVRGGTYPSASTARHIRGTAAAPIVFKPYPGEQVVIDHMAAGGNSYHVIDLSGGA